ncbi:MAG: MFS transporter [Nocardioidaceae bacterium]
MNLPASLAPLRDRDFRWFYSARSVSLFGSSLAGVALVFGVLEVSNRAGDLGIVLAAHSIPMAAFMLLGGVVADRFSRSTVLRLSHLGAALTQGAVAVLLITGQAQLWMLAVLEFANGVIVAFTFPALQGVVPQVVPRNELQQANAMLAFSRNAAYIAGPSVAGVLVVTVGAGWAIAVDAVTYAVAALCMSRLALPTALAAASSSMLRDLRVGWTEFTARTWVWVVVAAFGVMNMIFAGVWATLGPTIAKATIGEDAWGLVLSAEAVGFLVASLVLLRVTIRFPLRAGMIGALGIGAPMLLLGISPRVLPLVAAALLSGAGTEVFGIGWSTALQEHVPGPVLSRVASYDALGSFVAIPIGELLVGPLTHLLGQRTVVLAGTAIFVLVGLATLLSSSVRNLEHLPAPAATGEAHATP